MLVSCIGDVMKCIRCGNTEKEFFHEDAKGVYCRKCIMFGRVNINDAWKKRELEIVRKTTRMDIPYELTNEQLLISTNLIETILAHESALVYAACGAGKTEIVMPLIEYCINNQLRIAFAISRREVVLELATRLSQVFKNLDVIPVCEGHTEVDVGDLIVCTTHQLYRYPKSFDVLILDEIDAFPYAGNELLEYIATQSVKSSVIYLTATPDHSLKSKADKGDIRLFELFARPHGYPLVVPTIKRAPFVIQCAQVFRSMKKVVGNGKPVLLFVPTITWTKRMEIVLSMFFKVGSISSKTENKEEVMRSFQNGNINVLISTTILERGITIADVQVYVLMGDHVVFSEASLIQIIGRVGRKKEFPSGEGIIYCARKTKDIKNCVKALERMNASV